MKKTFRSLFSASRSLGLHALAFSLGMAHLGAELLVHEPFDYGRRQWTFGSDPGEGVHGLNGGFGFPGAWTNNGSLLAGIATDAEDFSGGAISGARTAPLSYIDAHGNQLIASDAQIRTAFGNNSWNRRPIGATLGTPGTTAWLSFLGQLHSIPAADQTRYAFVELTDWSGASSQSVWIGKVTPVRTGHWGINIPSNPYASGVSADFGGPIMVNEPTMFLVRLDFPEQSWDGTRIRVWLNPSNLTDEGTLGAPVYDGRAPHVYYTQIGVAGRISSDFDELRIGTTFDAVTPSEVVVLPPTEMPQLTISRRGAEILVAWPASVSGFTLFSSTDLVSWNPVGQEPTVEGDNRVVTFATSESRMFFRLQP
jgi:hypothetical protein